jgi:hypothetical protein
MKVLNKIAAASFLLAQCSPGLPRLKQSCILGTMAERTSIRLTMRRRSQRRAAKRQSASSPE